MSTGYRIFPPIGGRAFIIDGVTIEEKISRVNKTLENYGDYCDRNWLNDSGDLISPEMKVKGFLDRLAYFLLIGNTKGIETDYRAAVHNKTEIPVSSCPEYIEHMVYSSGGSSSEMDENDNSRFAGLLERLDEKAEKFKYEVAKKTPVESKQQKRRRLRIPHGVWERVDTDNTFVHNGVIHMIKDTVEQYRPKLTRNGLLYDMDRVLVSDGRYFDQEYNEITEFVI